MTSNGDDYMSRLVLAHIELCSNYAFHFHLALNFRLCTFKNVPASGRTPSPDQLPGLPASPLDRTVGSVVK